MAKSCDGDTDMKMPMKAPASKGRPPKAPVANAMAKKGFMPFAKKVK